MAAVAKITTKSGKARIVSLRKGLNMLAAEPTAIVEVIDDQTGDAVKAARVIREGGEVRVIVPESAPAASEPSQDVAGGPTTGQEPPATTGGDTAAATGASTGSGNGLLYGLLGAWALGGIAAAAAGGGGGGKSGGNTPPADTTPPPAPNGLTLAAADDTGVSNSDRITNQTSNLTISGTAEANAVVTLLNGTTVLGTATANASGAFSLDVSLPAGTHNITAMAKDAAGNTGPASAALSITVDTTAPNAPAGLRLAAADDSGASNSDGITSQTNNLTISGTAEAGSSVTLRNGATTLGTVTADANGAFSLDVTLPAGTHNITATATDIAGNASAASTVLAITVDTTAPAVPTVQLDAADDTGISSSDGITSQTSGLTLSGTAEAGSTVTLRDGATVLGTITAAANGTYSLDVSLPAGAHSITATATDVAGNSSAASAALPIAVDTTAPGVVITASSNLLLGAQTAVLTFTFSEAPQGFAASDISVSGGTISNLVVSASDPRVYTATLTPTAAAAGTLTVGVAGGTFTDVAGNAGVGATFGIAFDPGSSGTAIDGYLANALVFRDADNDGVWDHEAFVDANNNGLFDAGESFTDSNGDGSFTAEYYTVTDAQGDFTGLFGSGQIVLTPLIAGNGSVLTTDISTGKAFTGKLTAPDGATVVTPLTTLVNAIAGPGASASDVAAAEAKLKSALGISAGIDLATFDPIAAVAGNPDPAALASALAVQKAAVQVANILTVIGSASAAAGAAGGAETGYAAAIQSLAEQIVTQPTVDLAAAGTINGAIQAAANASGGDAARDALQQQAASLSQALGNVNGVIGAASGSDGVNVLTQIVTAQIVAQDELAGEVQTAIEGGTPLQSDNYSGDALSDKLDTAAAEVGTVVPQQPAAPNALGAPDRPTVDDGPRVSGSEAADGVVVTVTFAASAGVAAGDTLRLTIGADVAAAIVLTAEQVAAGTASITLPTAALGEDGTKSIVAGFVAADGTAGATSLPAVITLDTTTARPTLALSAESDTGVSSTDGITNKTELTLRGTAESNATIVIREGGTVVATVVADGAGRFSADVTAAPGPHAFTAVATDAAGNVSEVAELSVVVDTTPAAAPTALAVSDGTLITTTEAADGTTITGITDASSSVRVTLSNGAAVLTKDAVVSATGFSVVLSADEIRGLGEGTVTYTAVARDAAGNDSAAATGQYRFTNDPIVDPGARVDRPDLQVIEDDETGLGVTPLRGGGFVVHWVAEVGEDGYTVAVQRYNADGTKQGGIVTMKGLNNALLEDADDVSYDFQALDNGNYVISYALQQEMSGGTLTVSSGPGTVASVNFVGEPRFISVGNLPPTATYTLAGTGNDGAQRSVTLTASGGEIEVTQAILDQFGIDNRFTLQIGGLTPNIIAPIYVEVFRDVHYDPSSALSPINSTFTVLPNGVGLVRGDGDGRPEAFTIGSTTSTGTPNVLMQILPALGTFIDLTGIQGASQQPNGLIQITGIAPDANGVYRVPPQILAQIGTGDFNAYLVVTGLTAGSTLTGTASTREGIPTAEGLFVQTFDGAGNALASEVRVDTSDRPVSDDNDVVRVTQLPDSGFVVHWIVDAEGGTGGLAMQRFAADGSKVGTIVTLSGISPDLLEQAEANDDTAYDIRALDTGGYALVYTLQQPYSQYSTQFNGTPNSATQARTIVGRPEGIYIDGSFGPARVYLRGLGTDGQVKTIELARGYNEVADEDLAGFVNPSRLTLFVEGLGSGQTLFTDISAAQTVRYDTDGALTDTPPATLTVSVTGSVSFGSAGAETFRIEGGGTPTSAIISITLPGSSRQGGYDQIDISGVPGASWNVNGVFINGVTAQNGVYSIPEALLAQLDNLDYSASIQLNGLPANSQVSATTGVNAAIPIPEGAYVQLFGADGAATTPAGVRVDNDLLPVISEDDVGVGITPQAGGGFAVHWVVERAGEPNTVAIQRFNADGSKQGEPVVLSGISQTLTAAVGSETSYDLQALADGNYVLTYSLHLDGEWSRNVTLNNNGATAIVGRPAGLYVGSAPPGAVFSITGTGNDGQPLTVQLSPQNGQIRFEPAFFEQFSIDNRFSLRMIGAPSASFQLSSTPDVRYDETAPLIDIDRTGTANNSGIFSVSAVSVAGRAETFVLDSYAAGTNGVRVNMTIVSAVDAQGLSLNGIPGAVRNPDGSISINNMLSDANGVYRVPAALLAQLESYEVEDYVASIVITGLQPGSAIAASVGVREAIALLEGVFVQTFDENGVALDAGVDFTRASGEVILHGDGGTDVLQAEWLDDQLLDRPDHEFMIGGAGFDTVAGGAAVARIEPAQGRVLSVGELISDLNSTPDQIQLADDFGFAELMHVEGGNAAFGGAADQAAIDLIGGDILAKLAMSESELLTQVLMS